MSLSATTGRSEARLPDGHIGCTRSRGSGLFRDPARTPRNRSNRTLRLRPYRPGGLDWRDRRARSAHRLDVGGRLARPSERVRLHDGRLARRQPAPSGREAAALRRRSCARDPRDSLSRARDSRLGATAEDECRPPSARGRAAQPEQAVRPGRRTCSRERPADFPRLVSRAPVACRPTPSVPAGGDDSTSADRSRGAPAGGVPSRADARASGGTPFCPGTEQNLPANGCMRFHSSVRCDGIYWFRLFPLRYWDTTVLPDGRYRVVLRAWDVAANLATARRRSPSRTACSQTSGIKPSQATAPGSCSWA